ncbi:MAG: Eco57I restriction-modification methylase domain-containing protein [Pseudomonadota bacterium]
MGINEAILEKCDMVQSKKSRSDRKEKGVFYTPNEVVERMTEKLLAGIEPALNPYIRILDPACGSGLFLIKAFEVLKGRFEQDYLSILEKNKELAGKLQMDDIGSFIVENNLWGADIDQEAIDTAGEILVKLAGKACRPNLVCCDSLVCGTGAEADTDFWRGSFDYIIGNPPYIGHKQVTMEYKKVLQKSYKGIYRDKSDVSYCFLKRGSDLLSEGGRLSFITSRYFMEGPSASGLRSYLSEHCTVIELVDFNGHNVFKEAGIAACIITLDKGISGQRTSVLKYKKANRAGRESLFNPENYESFEVTRLMLKEEGWLLLEKDRKEIYKKVEESSGSIALGEVAESYQGIITGCDKAFIVSKDDIRLNKLEKPLLKPWIKNSNVHKHSIDKANRILIYSDFISREEDYPESIRHIGAFREKLVERRECRNGARKWYQLQWGRTNSIFDTPKIVYPYKSHESRFAVDRDGYYCSADVYCLKLKEKYEKAMSLEYLAAVLNSRLFEFYFKCYAKKISGNLYDYYPNTVLKMKIPLPAAGSRIPEMAWEITQCRAGQEKKAITDKIDMEIYKLYGLDDKQIELVEDNI